MFIIIFSVISNEALGKLICICTWSFVFGKVKELKNDITLKRAGFWLTAIIVLHELQKKRQHYKIFFENFKMASFPTNMFNKCERSTANFQLNRTKI